MHPLRAANDRVHWACRDAQRAANASALVYDRDGQRSLRAVDWIQRNRRATQQLRERIDAYCAAGRALINLGVAGCNRFSIRPASVVATFRALRLRQQGVDSICYGHRLFSRRGPE